MAETRKIYSKEFKQKAVELSNVRGNVQEIAERNKLIAAGRMKTRSWEEAEKEVFSKT